nr:uncharacterized protein cd79b [Nothobranchius furzeri]
MHWTLAGFCGLALTSLSVALQISQKPRFYGVKTGHSVGIYCSSSLKHLNSTVKWYKADEYNTEKMEIQTDERITLERKDLIQNAFLYLSALQTQDSGVYFCKINNTWGPGTKLQVVRPIDLSATLYRSKVKDGLIVLQGLMLAACITAVLLRKHKLVETSDSIYEEPETHHIYEGLAIETCEGALYEDLSLYQTEGAEAPWE